MSGTERLSRADLACAVGVVLIWGLNFVVMKVALAGLSPMLLGALRFMAATLPFLAFVARPALPWRILAAYGLAQGLGQFGFLFLGLQWGMTAGMASVVMQTQAFFTLLLAAPLLGERARPAQWWGIAIAMGGLLLIATSHGDGPGQMSLIGFVLTVSAAFMWALSNLIARWAGRVASYQAFPFVVWSGIFPIVPFLGLALWTDGADAMVRQLQNLNVPVLLAVLYLGWLATLLAYSLWTRLLQRHPAGRVTPFSLLVPVVGVWAAWAFLGEQPRPVQGLGAVFVLLGLLVNQVAWIRKMFDAARARGHRT